MVAFNKDGIILHKFENLWDSVIFFIFFFFFFFFFEKSDSVILISYFFKNNLLIYCFFNPFNKLVSMFHYEIIQEKYLMSVNFSKYCFILLLYISMWNWYPKWFCILLLTQFHTTWILWRSIDCMF